MELNIVTPPNRFKNIGIIILTVTLLDLLLWVFGFKIPSIIIAIIMIGISVSSSFKFKI